MPRKRSQGQISFTSVVLSLPAFPPRPAIYLPKMGRRSSIPEMTPQVVAMEYVLEGSRGWCMMCVIAWEDGSVWTPLST